MAHRRTNVAPGQKTWSHPRTDRVIRAVSPERPQPLTNTALQTTDKAFLLPSQLVRTVLAVSPFRRFCRCCDTASIGSVDTRTESAASSPPLWQLIVQLRESLGMSQVTLAQRLAERSGNPAITRTEISRWERGKRIPGPYWRTWLSEVLAVPPHRLETAAAAARRWRRSHKNDLPELAPYATERLSGVLQETVGRKRHKGHTTVVCRKNSSQ
jgi:putative transcriptional regulator